MKPNPRLLTLLAAALACAGLPAARAGRFPALNSPATGEHLPGKLVWADLFTTDPDGATRFYCGLLGWTATRVERGGKGYTVFSNGGVPVAGLAPRSVKGANHPARWIGYLSVRNMDTALRAASKDGGTVRAPSRKFPDRGLQAIVSDPDGVPFGLLQSSSGDSPDGEPAPGAWNWFELYERNPTSASDFYHGVIDLDVGPETHPDRRSDYVLSSAGRARGGVAPLPDTEDAKPSWLGVVRVANLDQTLAKVPGLGGEVLVAPRPVEYGSRFAIILDSTGGTIGLVEYEEGANPANNP
jgi:predicted enzyme related to lactoylglutathione lyase